ncbi:MAG: TonB-dependent receptor, partial [Bacteroidetes bacterium]
MPRFLGVKQFLLLTFLFTAQLGFAQTGKISGKVLDGNNMPVAGATVKIVNGKAGTATDIEGRFTLTVQPGRYSLTITALGFKTKTIEDVAVTRGGVEEVQFSLENASKVLDGVTVKASSAKKETTASIIQFQKNTNTVASVISAEAIRRSPDKNTGEVLKRVPGASIVDGKFLVVRGLSDRYNAALLNGVPLTSTEPDRKTFAFDMIPSGMIDNIIINKAFVPEMTGDWAGGLVQVNTRDIPSKGFLNVQV